jgi:peptide/nickel transport system permease protein
MLTFTIRRLLLAIPTLVLISLIIFLLLDLAPGDPIADQPLTSRPKSAEDARRAGPRFACLCALLLWAGSSSGSNRWSSSTGCSAPVSPKACSAISWQFRAPVIDIIIQRLPQTLWVVGCLCGRRDDRAADRHHLGLQAVFLVRPDRHLRHDDRLFGAALLLRRSGDRDLLGQLPWFPSIYDTTHKVNDWESFGSRSAR